MKVPSALETEWCRACCYTQEVGVASVADLLGVGTKLQYHYELEDQGQTLQATSRFHEAAELARNALSRQLILVTRCYLTKVAFVIRGQLK